MVFISYTAIDLRDFISEIKTTMESVNNSGNEKSV